MIAFPLPAAAAELPAGVQQILQQSELTPDKLVHITLQELLQTLAGWLKNAWGQPLQLARRAVLFLLLSSCVGLLADGGAWRDCVDLVAVLGFGTIALNQMTSLVQQVAQAANTSQLYVSGFVPVFAGVALLAGQTAGAAVYSTMFYAMAAFLAEVLQNLLLPLLQTGGSPAPLKYQKAPEEHPHKLCFHMSQPALPLFHVHGDSENASGPHPEPFLHIPEHLQ